MRKLIFTSFVLICFIAKGQVMDLRDQQDLALFGQMKKSEALIVNGKYMNTADLNGSPFMEEDFNSGFIMIPEDGKTIKAYIRYRIFDDMFEVKDQPSSDKIMLLDRGKNLEIKIGSKKFRFLTSYPIMMKGANNGYAQVLFEDKENNVALYKRTIQNYEPGKETTSGYSRSTKGRLDNEVFYFIEINDMLYQIEAHKRKAADAFPSKGDQLEDFIKDQKLKFRGNDEESDLVKLVEYYSTL